MRLILGSFLTISLGLFLGCGTKQPQISPASPEDRELPGPVLFEDITAKCGLAMAYRNGEDTANHLTILESLGGGVGLIDYDGDRLLDVFVPGGGYFTGAEQKEIVGHPSKLFRNLGKGQFADVTAQVGLEKLANEQPWFYTHAVAVGDYDRDGWPDLLVTGWQAIALFRNVPVDPNDASKGRRFVDVTKAAGLSTGVEWATSAAFADLDGDGYPELYVCQYVDWSWKKHPKCSYDGKTPDVCAPKEFSGLQHRLYHNTGKGTFVDITKQVPLREGGPTEGKGLGVLIVDVDGNGRPDVYVANDTVDNFLYLNQSKGGGSVRLSEVGLTSGSARDDRGTPNGSMGVDAGDPERTGKACLWVTNYENELHALYRNECRPGRAFFQFRTSAAGIGAIGQQYVGWGTAFIDVDLDGWEDLFIVNGHAIRFPTGKNSSRKQKPVLLLNQQGKFRMASNRIGEYAETPHLGRGAAFGDLDGDGRPDVVISNTNEPVAVLRGVGGEGHHWLGVRLVGKDNACIVGAKAVLSVGEAKLTRFAKAGGSYASSGDRRLLFGLGKEMPGRLTVSWPDGSVQNFDNLVADRYYVVQQGQARANIDHE